MLISCREDIIVATVDAEKITLTELNEFSEQKARLLGVEDLDREQERELLQTMIQREVAYLYAKQEKVEVPDAEMKEAMRGLSFLDRLRRKEDIEKNLIFEKVRSSIPGGQPIPSNEIKRYYDSHPDEFIVPETFKVYLVQVRAENARHVLEKATKNPGAFDDMALERVTPELRDINRNAPYTAKEDFPEEMWPYLEKMQVGDIAGPVKMKRGIFLFKLVDRKERQKKTLSEAAPAVEHILAAERSERAFQQWFDGMKNTYRIQIVHKDYQ